MTGTLRRLWNRFTRRPAEPAFDFDAFMDNLHKATDAQPLQIIGKPKTTYEYGYGIAFQAPLPTWAESEADIVEIVASVDYNTEPEDPEVYGPDGIAMLLPHNVEGSGFPMVTARFRMPDVRTNDLLVYSESSQSYAVIKHHAPPQATADLVGMLRAGWTYDEATRGH